MIVNIKARNIVHASKIMFGAMLFGMDAERIQRGTDYEVELQYDDPNKVLEVIRQYGGTVKGTRNA